ncbi:ATP-binding protein [Candidatus Woesearchaeota archaeon]|nr:ATP-binding protein [Candidatus Woesearchaeota archaeon]
MIDKEILKKVAQAQNDNVYVKKKFIVKRELSKEMNIDLSHATIISGIRRCGKSTLLKELMMHHKKRCYFNFEDPRAIDFELKDFERLEEVFKELYGNEIYYFFDEIQNVPQWERAIRHFLDYDKRCIITGSNASLLSRELGTKLTGRHLRHELFPFSYKETLELLKQEPNIDSFEIYFQKGGFPEYLKEQRAELLQSLLDNTITRDIIVRYNLRESKTVRELFAYLLNNIGKEFSYNKLAKYLDLGSPNTVISYISYFEDSYLLFTVPKFDYSLKKQLINPKKTYVIDSGFINANSVSFSSDKERILENIVFLQLRRKYKDIYYFRENKECDFIVRESYNQYNAIQVCYNLDRDNLNREIAGLQEAMKKLKLKKGLILTYNLEDTFDNIKVMPVWKWLMK